MPTLSSFWAFCSSSSIFCFSVTSLNTMTTPIILFSASRMEAPLSAIIRSVPSRLTSMVESSRPTVSSLTSTLLSGLSALWPVETSSR